MKTFSEFSKERKLNESEKKLSSHSDVTNDVNKFFSEHGKKNENGFQAKHIVGGSTVGSKHNLGATHDNVLHIRGSTNIKDLIHKHNGSYDSNYGSGHIETSDGHHHFFDSKHGTNYSVHTHSVRKPKE